MYALISYLHLNIIWNCILVNQPYVHCSNEFFKSHGFVQYYSDVNLCLKRNKLLIIIIIGLLFQLLIIYCFSAGIDLLMYSWGQQNIRRKLTCGKKA